MLHCEPEKRSFLFSTVYRKCSLILFKSRTGNPAKIYKNKRFKIVCFLYVMLIALCRHSRWKLSSWAYFTICGILSGKFVFPNYAKIIIVARNVKINMTVTAHAVTWHSTGYYRLPEKLQLKAPWGKDNLGDLDVDGNMLSNWFLKKQNVSPGTAFVYLKTCLSSGRLRQC